MIDLSTTPETVTVLPDDISPWFSADEPDGEQWVGGALSTADDAIYMIPCCATRVLKVDPTTLAVTAVPSDLGGHGHKWFGGCCSAKSGLVFGAPWNSEKVLGIGEQGGGGGIGRSPAVRPSPLNPSPPTRRHCSF